MNNSKKGLALLIVLVGLLIIIFTNLFGVTKIKDKTAAVENQNRMLKAQSDAYEQLFVKVPQFQKEMEGFKADREKLIGGFIYGYSNTDKIMYLTNLENQNVGGQLLIKYFNLGNYATEEFEPKVASDPALIAGGIANPVVTDDGIKLLKYPVNYGFEVSYDGFKDMVRYLNVVGGYKSIDSLTLSFDNSTGILSGALSFTQNVLVGTGAEYKPLGIPFVPTTVENIFGTVTVVPEVVTPEDGGDTEDNGDTAGN